MDGLRVTDTNSANDNKGRALGLDGNDFIAVVVGFVLALGAYLLLTTLFGAGRLVSLAIALPFLVGPLAWALLLRRNKPEGFAEDWFDQRVASEGWSYSAQLQPAARRVTS